MASQFSLASLCGRCFRPVGGSAGGFILSCSDFVCMQCSSNGCITSCPACGKQNVQALDLSTSLPEEVQGSILDPVLQLEAMANTVKFQIKYYKQTIRKLLAKVTQLGKENAQMKSLLQQRDRPVTQVTHGQPPGSHQTRSNFFEDERPSLSQALSYPLNPAEQQMRPSTTAARSVGAPSASAGHPSTSLLSKRPSTSLNDSDSAGPFRSPHFSQPPPPFSQQARPSTTQPTPAAQSQAAAEASWGFGVPPARALVTPATSSAAPTQTAAQGYHAQGGDAVQGGSPAKPRPYTSYTTPSNLARPPSAQRSPPFVTPSRLRSPHPPIARTGSGGMGRGSSGSFGAANPLQGVGVTVSQQQRGDVSGAKTLQGFLSSATSSVGGSSGGGGAFGTQN